MIRQIATALLAVFLLSLASVNAVEAQPRTLIVMDGSGSMWGQIDGRTKLEIARETAAHVLSRVPSERELGLMAYGHRVRGDCGDIELMVSPAPGQTGNILAAVNGMRFQGKTPITEAVRQAAEVLRSTEEPATVILITDGFETCEADPCALAADLEASGVGFTAHVIGLGLSQDDGAQVACIAENTGGRYMQANDADALADALAAAIGDDAAMATLPAPDMPEQERSRHFPGAEVMPGIALAPTGQSFGPVASYPAEFSFPPDGTIAQCQAQCAADALCGAWRYEPQGSYFVEEARCFAFNPQTEFVVNAYPLDEGWASGMKPGVVGLTRPYVPINAEDIVASLSVPEPVVPGEDFTVLWKGPAGERDWVDLVPAGHEELSGELSYFYVNDTIEANDLPEGAGVLTAPAEAGQYELRYVFGRDIDRHVVIRVPLTVGGNGPGTAQAQPSPPPAVAGLVEATFTADTGGLELAVSWSATPVPGQDLPPEAWVLQESVIGPVSELFLPGRYNVVGDAGDSVFVAQVEVTPAGPNQFMIPHHDRLSPAGEDQAGGYSCDSKEPCRIEDATGLSFTLPAGWRSDEPFIAETAGGAKAPYPTVTFTSADGSSAITLNPLRWLESSGTCSASGIGELCIHGQPSGDALLAYSIILPSLTYQSQQARIPDFGGQSFVPPNGRKVLATLVPGWGG